MSRDASPLRRLRRRVRPAVGHAVDALIRLDSTAQKRTAPSEDDRMMKYQASYWLTVPLGLRGVRPAEGDCFVDFGCGKGRSLYCAAWFPFARIVGVDLDPEMVEAARGNMAAARGPRRLRQVEIVAGDARTAPLPDRVRVAFFFNPFRGEVFESVARRVREGADRSGVPVRVIYANPVEADTMRRLGFELVRRSRHCDVYDYERSR